MKVLLFFCRALPVGLVLFSNASAQWSQTSFPESLDVRAFAITSSNFIAGSWGDGIFVSSDSGTSWRSVNIGLTDTFVTSLATHGAVIFAGTDGVAGSGPGVFVSTNNGGTWTVANNGLGHTDVFGLGVLGTSIFAGTTSGAYSSTNNGLNWTPSGLASYETFAFAAIGPGPIYFAGTNAGVWLSLNYGVNWIWFSNLGVTFVRALIAHGSTLFVGTEGDGIFVSTNDGVTWTAANAGLTSLYVWALAARDSNLFAGTYDGVFLSKDSGASWTNINQGLPCYVRAFAIIDTNLFAGVSYGGVWKRSLNEVLTFVAGSSTTLPVHSSLDQNYPNPFNPSTIITFYIPQSSLVTLTVFDLLGREAEVLVNDHKESGAHQAVWDATGHASGVYFYKITAGDFHQVRKMILIR